MKIRSILFYLGLSLICQGHLFAQKKSISIALGYIPHVQFAPFYIAEKRGYFERENLDVSLQYTNTTQAMTLVAQKKIDIALADADAVIQAKAQGLPVQVFFQYYQKSPISIFSINEEIRSIKNLEGKVIGTPELTGSSYLALMLFLKHYDLKDKVQIQRIGYEQVALLKSKKIDAAVGYSNHEPVYFADQNQWLKVWDTQEFAPLLAGSALLGHEKLMRESPQLYRRFSRAMQNAINTIMNQPQESFEELIPILNIREDQKNLMYKIFVASVRECFSPNTTPLPASYNFTIEQMKELGLLNKDVSSEDVIAKNINS